MSKNKKLKTSAYLKKYLEIKELYQKKMFFACFLYFVLQDVSYFSFSVT